MANFAELLTEAAAEYPDRVALKLDDAEVSYAVLDLPKGPTGKILKREIEPPER